MGINFFVRLFQFIESIKYKCWVRLSSKKQLNQLRSELIQIVKLTAAQKKEIKEYYATLGAKNIDYGWHQFYYSLNGKFNRAYISPYVFNTVLMLNLYDQRIVKAYDDKNLYDLLFPEIKQPQKIVKCSNGHFYADGNHISKESALHICWNIEEAIIKPSIYTDGGKGVKFLSVKGGVTSLQGASIEEIFASYGKNFVVEKKIQQHKDLSRLNESSCNSLRIMTYYRDNQVVLLVSIIRIGKPGSVIDNFSDSGLVCKVKDDGYLEEWGYSKHPLAKTDRLNNGLYFKDVRIPFYENIIETVKKAHLKLPHFPIVGWDIAVDSCGDVVLIEFNAPCDIIISQFVDGRAFGDYTEEILAKVYGKA